MLEIFFICLLGVSGVNYRATLNRLVYCSTAFNVAQFSTVSIISHFSAVLIVFEQKGQYRSTIIVITYLPHDAGQLHNGKAELSC